MPDREKVIEDLVEHIESTLAVCDEFADGIPLDLLQYTVHLLKEQEAVVRCKDCKWFMPDDTCGNKRLSDQEDIATLGPDWFCADGKRREDDA